MPTIAPLPNCAEPGWYQQRAEQYAALPLEPLRVTAVLDRAYIPGHGGTVMLDSLLAAAVAREAPPTNYRQDTASVIPIPALALAVLDGAGGARLPLWAATALNPTNPTTTSAAHHHKRYPEHLAPLGSLKRTVDTRVGQHKDRRTPHALTVTERATGVLIGNRDEVRRLLTLTPHLGKRHNAGHGRVLQWLVEPLTFTTDEAISLITAARPIPLRAQELVPTSGRTETVTWTPPYWYAPWREPCRAP